MNKKRTQKQTKKRFPSWLTSDDINKEHIVQETQKPEYRANGTRKGQPEWLVFDEEPSFNEIKKRLPEWLLSEFEEESSSSTTSDKQHIDTKSQSRQPDWLNDPEAWEIPKSKSKSKPNYWNLDYLTEKETEYLKARGFYKYCKGHRPDIVRSIIQQIQYMERRVETNITLEKVIKSDLPMIREKAELEELEDLNAQIIKTNAQIEYDSEIKEDFIIPTKDSFNFNTNAESQHYQLTHVAFDVENNLQNQQPMYCCAYNYEANRLCLAVNTKNHPELTGKFYLIKLQAKNREIDLYLIFTPNLWESLFVADVECLVATIFESALMSGHNHLRSVLDKLHLPEKIKINTRLLEEHINGFPKRRSTWIAHNARFDIDMLNSTSKKANYKFTFFQKRLEHDVVKYYMGKIIDPKKHNDPKIKNKIYNVNHYKVHLGNHDAGFKFRITIDQNTGKVIYRANLSPIQQKSFTHVWITDTIQVSFAMQNPDHGLKDISVGTGFQKIDFPELKFPIEEMNIYDQQKITDPAKYLLFDTFATIAGYSQESLQLNYSEMEKLIQENGLPDFELKVDWKPRMSSLLSTATIAKQFIFPYLEGKTGLKRKAIENNIVHERQYQRNFEKVYSGGVSEASIYGVLESLFETDELIFYDDFESLYPSIARLVFADLIYQLAAKRQLHKYLKTDTEKTKKDFWHLMEKLVKIIRKALKGRSIQLPENLFQNMIGTVQIYSSHPLQIRTHNKKGKRCWKKIHGKVQLHLIDLMNAVIRAVLEPDSNTPLHVLYNQIHFIKAERLDFSRIQVPKFGEEFFTLMMELRREKKSQGDTIEKMLKYIINSGVGLTAEGISSKEDFTGKLFIPVIFASVTAGSRFLIAIPELMCQALGGTMAYTDTDSIVYRIHKSLRSRITQLFPKLSVLKEETDYGRIHKAFINRKKKYYFLSENINEKKFKKQSIRVSEIEHGKTFVIAEQLINYLIQLKEVQQLWIMNPIGIDPNIQLLINSNLMTLLKSLMKDGMMEITALSVVQDAFHEIIRRLNLPSFNSRMPVDYVEIPLNLSSIPQVSLQKLFLESIHIISDATLTALKVLQKKLHKINSFFIVGKVHGVASYDKRLYVKTAFPIVYELLKNFTIENAKETIEKAVQKHHHKHPRFMRLTYKRKTEAKIKGVLYFFQKTRNINVQYQVNGKKKKDTVRIPNPVITLHKGLFDDFDIFFYYDLSSNNLLITNLDEKPIRSNFGIYANLGKNHVKIFSTLPFRDEHQLDWENRFLKFILETFHEQYDNFYSIIQQNQANFIINYRKTILKSFKGDFDEHFHLTTDNIEKQFDYVFKTIKPPIPKTKRFFDRSYQPLSFKSIKFDAKTKSWYQFVEVYGDWFTGEYGSNSGDIQSLIATEIETEGKYLKFFSKLSKYLGFNPIKAPTIRELKRLASEHNIPNRSKMSRNELWFHVKDFWYRENNPSQTIEHLILRIQNDYHEYCFDGTAFTIIDAIMNTNTFEYNQYLALKDIKATNKLDPTDYRDIRGYQLFDSFFQKIIRSFQTEAIAKVDLQKKLKTQFTFDKEYVNRYIHTVHDKHYDLRVEKQKKKADSEEMLTHTVMDHKIFIDGTDYRLWCYFPDLDFSEELVANQNTFYSQILINLGRVGSYIYYQTHSRASHIPKIWSTDVAELPCPKTGRQIHIPFRMRLLLDLNRTKFTLNEIKLAYNSFEIQKLLQKGVIEKSKNHYRVKNSREMVKFTQKQVYDKAYMIFGKDKPTNQENDFPIYHSRSYCGRAYAFEIITNKSYEYNSKMYINFVVGENKQENQRIMFADLHINPNSHNLLNIELFETNIKDLEADDFIVKELLLGLFTVKELAYFSRNASLTVEDMAKKEELTYLRKATYLFFTHAIVEEQIKHNSQTKIGMLALTGQIVPKHIDPQTLFSFVNSAIVREHDKWIRSLDPKTALSIQAKQISAQPHRASFGITVNHWKSGIHLSLYTKDKHWYKSKLSRTARSRKFEITPKLSERVMTEVWEEFTIRFEITLKGFDAIHCPEYHAILRDLEQFFLQLDEIFKAEQETTENFNRVVTKIQKILPNPLFCTTYETELKKITQDTGKEFKAKINKSGYSKRIHTPEIPDPPPVSS